MRYGFILLDNVRDVNSYNPTDHLQVVQDDSVDIYLQIVSLAKRGVINETLRFIPPTNVSTITASFNNIDDSKDIIDRSASQPFSLDDRSIWKITLMAGETFNPNSMSVKFFDGIKIYSLTALSDIEMISNSGSENFFC